MRNGQTQYAEYIRTYKGIFIHYMWIVNAVFKAYKAVEKLLKFFFLNRKILVALKMKQFFFIKSS